MSLDAKVGVRTSHFSCLRIGRKSCLQKGHDFCEDTATRLGMNFHLRLPLLYCPADSTAGVTTATANPSSTMSTFASGNLKAELKFDLSTEFRAGGLECQSARSMMN
eukprot:m.64100 g.64100  ORF g.64100 m.64100 type:complete len:107 (+) comp9698_c1_seq2:77-397(+)